jgi:PAS domain S-box-containing protein
MKDKRVKNRPKEKSYDWIITLVTLYFAFVVIAIGTILGIDRYVHKRMNYLYGLMSNERSRIEINNIVRNRLDNLRGYMHQYVSSGSFNEMDRLEKLVHENSERLKIELDVLENGGSIFKTYDIGYAGIKSVENKYTYVNYRKSKFNLEVLEVRAKIVEMERLLDSFRDAVIDSIISKRLGSFDMLQKSSLELSNKTKSMVAFFERLSSSSNRLYIESHKEMQAINDVIKSSRVEFRLTKIYSNTFFAFLLGISGIILLLKVRSIVKSRKRINKELNETNENLENIVKDRTVELEQEIYIRKQTEKESVEKAQFLIDVIESLGQPFYVINAETYEIVIANRHVYDTMGRGGKTCHELTHMSISPCSGDEHPCPLHMVKKYKKPVVVEHIHRHKNGDRRFYEIHGYPIFDDEGKVIQMIEYSIDITEKKEAESAILKLNSQLEEMVAERTRKLELEIKNREDAEQRLVKSEKHFRYLIENITDMIVVLDRRNRITYSSNSVKYVTGFSDEQLSGKCFEDFIHSSDRVRFNVWLNNLSEVPDTSARIEIRIQKRTGEWIYGEAIATNLINNEVINGIVINLRDISLRKKAEKEIRKLASVMEQSPASIVVTDYEGKIEYVNPMFETITGYCLDEVIGQNPNILQSGRTRPEVFEDMWTTIKKGKVWNGEFINKKKNNDIYTENATIAPITNERGEIVNFVGMKENVTELKHARAKAEEASKAKSQFIANMSHEIRTPLNGLMGFIELLINTELDERQKHYVDTVKYSADSLLAILNDILDLSKIESGMMELEESDFDVHSSVSVLTSLFYGKAYEKSIQLLLFDDPKIPAVIKGDSLRINQVIGNLLGNAIKFTPEGGSVLISVSCLDKTEDSVTVRFSVKDTGVGIPSEKLELIFESFSQADSSVTRKFGGSGLGLTISRKIVKMMGSDISVESKVGEGSCFTFDVNFQISPMVSEPKWKKVEKKVYLQKKSDSIIFDTVKKYIDSFDIEAEVFEDLSGIKDIQNSSSVILFDGQSDEEFMEKVKQSVARIILVSDSAVSVNFEQSDGVVLNIPFDAKEFFSAVSGELVGNERIQNSNTGHGIKYNGKVLLAEDNRINIELMQSVLDSFGVEVETAEDGEVAVDKFLKSDFDLILMDINMPKADGIAAASIINRIEEEESKKHTPVVALSAHVYSDGNKRLKDADFDDYITKPFKLDDLKALFDKYLTLVDTGSVTLDQTMSEIADDIGLPEDVVIELTQSFLLKSIDEIDFIYAMINKNDYESLRLKIHSLKGAAKNLRLNRLGELLDDFEKLFNSGVEEDFKDILKVIESEIKDLIKKYNFAGN